MTTIKEITNIFKTNIGESRTHASLYLDNFKIILERNVSTSNSLNDIDERLYMKHYKSALKNKTEGMVSLANVEQSEFTAKGKPKDTLKLLHFDQPKSSSKETTEDIVSLKDMILTFNVPFLSNGYDICSISNGSYLLADLGRVIVCRLASLFSDVKLLRLPGLAERVCEAEANQAVVYTVQFSLQKHKSCFKIHFINLDSLNIVRSFCITDHCSGIVYIDKCLYLNHSHSISVYSVEGDYIKTLFQQTPSDTIDEMTKGPNKTLACVVWNGSIHFCQLINGNGHFIKNILYNQNYTLPNILDFVLPMTADADGNFYFMNSKSTSILKVTESGTTETLTAPVIANRLCYDNTCDMLVLLSDNKLFLKAVK